MHVSQNATHRSRNAQDLTPMSTFYSRFYVYFYFFTIVISQILRPKTIKSVSDIIFDSTIQAYNFCHYIEKKFIAELTHKTHRKKEKRVAKTS